MSKKKISPLLIQKREGFVTWVAGDLLRLILPPSSC